MVQVTIYTGRPRSSTKNLLGNLWQHLQSGKCWLHVGEHLRLQHSPLHRDPPIYGVTNGWKCGNENTPIKHLCIGHKTNHISRFGRHFSKYQRKHATGCVEILQKIGQNVISCVDHQTGNVNFDTWAEILICRLNDLKTLFFQLAKAAEIGLEHAKAAEIGYLPEMAHLPHDLTVAAM